MSRTYRVRTKINKPLAQVFNAVVSKELITKYFSDGASGDLVAGEVIVWQWSGASDHPVTVTKVEKNQLVEIVLDSLDWQKSNGESYKITVRFEFESLDDNSTMVSISESGWIDTEDGIKGSYDNCEGWTHMLMCLKAFLEFAIDLR